VAGELPSGRGSTIPVLIFIYIYKTNTQEKEKAKLFSKNCKQSNLKETKPKPKKNTPITIEHVLVTEDVTDEYHRIWRKKKVKQMFQAVIIQLKIYFLIQVLLVFF